MRLVVGLGNPGPRYRNTRHNLGFQVVEELARQEGWSFETRPWWRWARGRLAEAEVVVAQPLTFMNDSGRAVGPLVEALGVAGEDLLVVCDDLALPLGRIRLRRRGSSGGHKGLASIIQALATEEFPRLRIGIGPVRGEAVEFVLGEFDRAERATIEEAVREAVEAVRSWATRGIEEAMNRFNRRTGASQGGACETV